MINDLYRPYPEPEKCEKRPGKPPCPPPPPPELPPFCPDNRPRHCAPTPPPEFPPFCPDDRPHHCAPPPPPPCPPMPPVPSVVRGMDLYEAMDKLSDRVNICIHNYNAVMSESYKTLHNLQRAAEENGAYYGPGEVWVEEGYYADESSTYHLVHKACVDRRGEPIRMQLHLAYGNTTNSQIEQAIFHASKVEYADKMMVAIPKTDKGWYGKAIWHGCPIQSDDQPELYTVGFTKSGVMRVYNNGVDVNQMLRDTVENAMGCSGVLIQNGQITDDSYRVHIPDAEKQTSRVCIGQNLNTREVIILTVGNENDVNRKGLTSKACAEILRQYGCDIAVELCEGVGSGAVDKGSLMYVPDDVKEPTAYAYWFISRKCFYRNDYERELAELVQNYGRCLWQGFLNERNIAQVKADLEKEIERAKAAEEQLQDNIDAERDRAMAEEDRLDKKIDAETDRAQEAERVLQENIDKEQARAEAEEHRLDEKIDAETTRATNEEQRIEGRLNDEIQRATSEETRIEGRLNEEITRATTEEKRIDARLTEEINRAKNAEQVLQDNIDKEQHRAENAEANLHQEIITEQGQRIAADEVLQGNINKEAADRAAADNALQANIDKEVQDRQSEDAKLKGFIDALDVRVTACETDIQKLYALIATLQNQMTALDTTVTEMVNTIAEIETAMNNLKVSVTNIINGTTKLPYVRLIGDTMTGPLVMAGADGSAKGSFAVSDAGVSIKASDGAFIKVDSERVTVGDNTGADVVVRGVADPVEDNDAVNKKWVLSNTTTDLPRLYDYNTHEELESWVAAVPGQGRTIYAEAITPTPYRKVYMSMPKVPEITKTLTVINPETQEATEVTKTLYPGWYPIIDTNGKLYDTILEGNPRMYSGLEIAGIDERVCLVDFLSEDIYACIFTVAYSSKDIPG